MLKIAEYAEKRAELRKKAEELFSEAGMELELKNDKADRIRLVFAGQYSAGKSSILKMLTGKEDIAIGAGITTQQTNTYEWKGLEVIDTPGIHTELRPDHDAISYEAIASADLLVFVITNELFDAHIAEHFRKLAIDRDKAGEMILVVNKMERAAEGNSPIQQDIIREDLRKVLAPYTPEQLNLSFLDAESYLDSIAEREADAELADELVERSGYREFVETLNRFVAKKGISAKLTTELYIMDEQLEKAIQEAQPKSEDPDIDALEENFLQQRYALTDARGRLQREVRGIYTSAASRIRETGLEAANLLEEGCEADVVEVKLGCAIGQVNEMIEECQTEAGEIIKARLNEVGQNLEVIENSKFSSELKARLTGKFSGLPEGIQKMLAEAGSEFQKIGKSVENHGYRVGVNGGWDIRNFSGSKIHEWVLKIGHKLGYKFKPWQAAKITRGVTVFGEVLGALGVGIEIFQQAKNDRDERKIREAMRDNRQNIRSQFFAAANGLEEFAGQYIEAYVNEPFEVSISQIDEGIGEIRDSRSNRSLLCLRMEDLQKECRKLIREIHAEDSEEAANVDSISVDETLII